MDIKKEIYVILVIILGVFNFIGCGIDSGGSNSAAPAATESGSVTISWKTPLSDANGSNLNDLGGYKVYYGMSSMNYIRTVDVGRFTGAVISNLSRGRWCFSVTAYDVSGNESKYSNEMCKTI